MARAIDLPVIINPAPAQPLPDSVLQNLYCVTPNETEAEALTGIAVTNLESATAACDALLKRGVQNAVITMGSAGALLRNEKGSFHQPAEAVTVVDTTAAGDTFNGVFAAMIAGQQSLEEAMLKAVAAATISVQTAGAINSIPRLDQ